MHNRYRTEQPSGEDNVVDQEVALLREAGHRVDRFERRSDDIASMSLPRKAMVPLTVPWNPAARTALAARLRAERPDVVHVHNTFPLLSPSVLDACRTAGVPVVATLHNYTQVCPAGTLYRDGATCTACVGKLPLPAVRHGCYRGSSARDRAAGAHPGREPPPLVVDGVAVPVHLGRAARARSSRTACRRTCWP